MLDTARGGVKFNSCGGVPGMSPGASAGSFSTAAGTGAGSFFTAKG